MLLQQHSRIYVAGHLGLAGSAMLRLLQQRGFGNLILRTRQQLDLRDAAAVDHFFAEQRPEFVFLLAARVGGIQANSSYPADFIYDNLAIQTNVIHRAQRHDVKKLLYPGSTCVYPRLSPQPIKEEYLLEGALEPTNQWYAAAKLAGIKMVDGYARQYGLKAVVPMVTNLFGPGDNFDLEYGHVLPAFIRKFVEAADQSVQQVTLWGSGTAQREFLYSDDLAEAMLLLMEKHQNSGPINVGVGKDISIRDLATLVAEEAGFKGAILFDQSKADGMPRKLLDVSKIHQLGWQAQTSLRQGIQKTIQWYRSTYPNGYKPRASVAR
jgi:GDP-L-fucose synthase